MAWLDLSAGAVRDLTPLQDSSLTVLRIGFTAVHDLAPLSGLPLAELECQGIPATDFSPLSQCLKLRYLRLSDTTLTELAPLRHLPLGYLYFHNTQVRDLTPLAGMPLYHIGFCGTPVTDVSPLLQCRSLVSIGLAEGVRNVEILRSMPNLRRISYHLDEAGDPAQSATEFWAEHDAAR